jgi:uncharacterized membrane protein
MIKKRLAIALSIALLSVPIADAARYEVVELPVVNEGRSSFPSAINEEGKVTVNVTSPYNIPIDLDPLDFTSETLINFLTDPEAASMGDINDVDYELLLALISSADGVQSAQQIASTISFFASEDETVFIPVFDTLTDQGNEFSISTNTNVRDINDAGFAAGTGEGFYSKIDYRLKTPEGDPPQLEDTTFIIREFGTRGFASLGDTVVDLLSPVSTLGGFSEAYGINENNKVIGYGATLLLSDSLQIAITNCENEELVQGGVDEIPATETTPLIPATHHLPTRGNVPVESCISNLASTFTNAVTTYAQLRGLIWQLDVQGNVLETTVLGLLFEPEEDDTLNYTSQAVAINDNGIAVGNSNGQYTEGDVTVIRNFAVIFDNNGEVINITPDPDSDVATTSNTISSAADINNDNLVVGNQIKRVNGVNRTKFFVYDMDLSELVLPTDFFLGSSSVATDINNNGLVVGYGETDASIIDRRKEGFLYDHNTKEFNGLDELISCDAPYTLVQANAINDKGEIVATALYQGPTRNSRGEIFLDESGEEVIIDLIRVVKLVPVVGGAIEDCGEPIDEINRDRQGAGISWLLLLCISLFGLRRFRN